MEERGVGGDSNPCEDSEMPAAGENAAASNGRSAQERTSSSSYYNRPNASNKDDSSPDEEIIKIWSQKAAGWRFVTAKYIETQIDKGEASFEDERAWTSYKRFSGWIKHEERFEVEDPEKDKRSWTWADRSSTSNKDSSNKDDASTSSKKKDKKAEAQNMVLPAQRKVRQ